jgi:hypothetical protein
MTRWIAVAGCAALALALAAPLGNQAEADGMPTPRAVYKHKRCIAPASWWWRTGASQTTWVCSISEKCCYDRLLRKGTCVASNARCI